MLERDHCDPSSVMREAMEVCNIMSLRSKVEHDHTYCRREHHGGAEKFTRFRARNRREKISASINFSVIGDHGKDVGKKDDSAEAVEMNDILISRSKVQHDHTYCRPESPGVLRKARFEFGSGTVSENFSIPQEDGKRADKEENKGDEGELTARPLLDLAGIESGTLQVGKNLLGRGSSLCGTNGGRSCWGGGGKNENVDPACVWGGITSSDWKVRCARKIKTKYLKFLSRSRRGSRGLSSLEAENSRFGGMTKRGRHLMGRSGGFTGKKLTTLDQLYFECGMVFICDLLEILASEGPNPGYLRIMTSGSSNPAADDAALNVEEVRSMAFNYGKMITADKRVRIRLSDAPLGSLSKNLNFNPARAVDWRRSRLPAAIPRFSGIKNHPLLKARIKFLTLKMGIGPNSICLKPRQVGVNPRSLGVNPRSLRVNPRSLGVNPKALGVNPKALLEEIQNMLK